MLKSSLKGDTAQYNVVSVSLFKLYTNQTCLSLFKLVGTCSLKVGLIPCLNLPSSSHFQVSHAQKVFPFFLFFFSSVAPQQKFWEMVPSKRITNSFLRKSTFDLWNQFCNFFFFFQLTFVDLLFV